MYITEMVRSSSHSSHLCPFITERHGDFASSILPVETYVAKILASRSRDLLVSAFILRHTMVEDLHNSYAVIPARLVFQSSLERWSKIFAALTTHSATKAVGQGRENHSPHLGLHRQDRCCLLFHSCGARRWWTHVHSDQRCSVHHLIVDSSHCQSCDPHETCPNSFRHCLGQQALNHSNDVNGR